MSTGPEHYAEAARLAATATRWADAPLATVDAAATVAAVNGLTHAVLAVAAAVALMPTVGNEGDTAAEWRRAIVKPRRPIVVPDDDPTEGNAP